MVWSVIRSPGLDYNHSMPRVSFSLYSIIDNSPLIGAAPSVVSLVRVNQDGTSAALTPPASVGNVAGSNAYWFDIDDALLLPGSLLRYVIDATVDASARYFDGELDAGNPSPATFGTLDVGAGDEIILRKGDRAPSLVMTLRDASGAAVDLSSGSPSAVFNMRSDQGGDLVIDAGAMTIVDAPGGKVLFPWPDSASWSGNYFYEAVLTQAALPSTYPYGRSGIVRVMPGV